MVFGYIRTGSSNLDLTGQKRDLQAAGCERIYRDVTVGAAPERRNLAALLARAEKGDVIVVWRLDRVGRSLPDLVQTIQDLERRGIGFLSLVERIDTTKQSGRLTARLFGALAQFEKNSMRERVGIGLAAARACGRVGGRPRIVNDARMKLARRLMGAPDRNVAEVCRTLGVSRSTLYRLIRNGD